MEEQEFGRDSEDPDDVEETENGNDDTMYGEDRKEEGHDSELLEDRYRQMDPELEKKINQVRNGRSTTDGEKRTHGSMM